MPNVRFPLIKAALGSAMLLVTVACGDKETSPTAAPAPSIPSIVDDKPAMASIDSRALTVPDVAPAIPEAAALASEEPVMPESFSELVSVAKGSDDVEIAMRALAMARERRPSSVIPDIESARVMLKAGRLSEARAFAESAVDVDSKSSYAWNTMGRLELMEGDLDAAVASFERAAEENEDNSFAWNNLGLTLMRLDRVPEAVSALERATSGAKPTEYMWNNLGMAYELAHRPDLAVSAYRQAVSLGSARAEVNIERLAKDEPAAFATPAEVAPGDAGPIDGETGE